MIALISRVVNIAGGDRAQCSLPVVWCQWSFHKLPALIVQLRVADDESREQSCGTNADEQPDQHMDPFRECWLRGKAQTIQLSPDELIHRGRSAVQRQYTGFRAGNAAISNGKNAAALRAFT